MLTPTRSSIPLPTTGSTWRRLPAQAAATGKELSMRCPEPREQQQGHGPKQRTLQGSDNLNWATHSPGQFAKERASFFFTTGAEMRMQPKHGEEPRREPGCRRHPQPAAPSSHPEAGAGKAAPASQEEQRPHPIPPRAASRFHPAEDKGCGPWLACGKLGARGRILPGERGL